MLWFLHLVALLLSFVSLTLKRKKEGGELVEVGWGGVGCLCFQAGKFEVLCLEARFRVLCSV